MAACNKIQYSSKQEALKDIKTVLSVKDNKKLSAYKCYMCDYFHVTSMKKRDSKTISKNNKELSRKLRIIKSIRNVASLAYVLKCQEDWMTLNTNNMTVEFDVLNETKVVKLIK